MLTFVKFLRQVHECLLCYFFICLKFWNWKIKNLLSENNRFPAEIRKIAKGKTKNHPKLHRPDIHLGVYPFGSLSCSKGNVRLAFFIITSQAHAFNSFRNFNWNDHRQINKNKWVGVGGGGGQTQETGILPSNKHNVGCPHRTPAQGDGGRAGHRPVELSLLAAGQATGGTFSTELLMRALRGEGSALLTSAAKINSERKLLCPAGNFSPAMLTPRNSLPTHHRQPKPQLAKENYKNTSFSIFRLPETNRSNKDLVRSLPESILFKIQEWTRSLSLKMQKENKITEGKEKTKIREFKSRLCWDVSQE